MKGFVKYDKEELLNRIEKLSIERIENQVITKYNNRVINVTDVSNRYEVFDIVTFLKDKINVIDKNFDVVKYKFELHKGKQMLTLISDSVEIGGVEFHKSFYILNSTDKSRRLSFNIGLKSNNFYAIGSNNVSFSKKHLNGVTESALDVSSGLSGETFSEQIEDIKSLLGHTIRLSKLREVILGDDPKKVDHQKFDAFKNMIRFANSDLKLNLTNEQRNELFTESSKIESIQNDFYLDAFWSFQLYLRIFNKQDAHVIKKETEKIMGITQWAVRNSILEELGI